jgi:hypothetical protein
MTILLTPAGSREFFELLSCLPRRLPPLLFQQVFGDGAHHPIVEAVGQEGRHKHQWFSPGADDVTGLGTRGLDGLDDLASYDVWFRRGTGGGEEQSVLLLGLSAIGGVARRLPQTIEGDPAPLSANGSGSMTMTSMPKGFEFDAQAVTEAFHSELGRMVPCAEWFPSPATD